MTTPNITRNKNDLADTLALQLRAMRFPPCEREWLAIEGRRFRCDLAWPHRTPRLYVECDGGEMMQGRHNRAQGMASDCEKQALLVLAGWVGFRFVGSQIKNGFALAILERYFDAHL